MKDEKEDLSFQEHLLKLIIAKDMDNKVLMLKMRIKE